MDMVSPRRRGAPGAGSSIEISNRSRPIGRTQPGNPHFSCVEMTIEQKVSNLSREGLVMTSSMVISTKNIGPGISGSTMPSHSGTSSLSSARNECPAICLHKSSMHYRASDPAGPRPFIYFIFVEMSIELYPGKTPLIYRRPSGLRRPTRGSSPKLVELSTQLTQHAAGWFRRHVQ